MFHYELSSRKIRVSVVLHPFVKERKMRSLHLLLCKGLIPLTFFSAFYSTQDRGKGINKEREEESQEEMKCLMHSQLLSTYCFLL